MIVPLQHALEQLNQEGHVETKQRTVRVDVTTIETNYSIIT